MDKLSAHQESTLRMLLEDFDPEKVKWSDVQRDDGYGRNPTFGETVSVDNTWDITVDSVTTSQGDSINVPKSGNTFVKYSPA